MKGKVQEEIERNLDGRFKITDPEPIGKGNYAKVYKGIKVDYPDYQVAVKVKFKYILASQIIQSRRKYNKVAKK